METKKRYRVCIGDNGFGITDVQLCTWDMLQHLTNVCSVSFDTYEEACTVAYRMAAERCIRLGHGPIYARIELPLDPPYNQIAYFRTNKEISSNDPR